MTGSSIPAASRYGFTLRNMRPVAMTTWMPASRAAWIAVRVRGRSSPSVQRSVRSRSHARTSTSRGNPVGRFRSAAGLDDVGGHVGDLLVAQLAFERRHAAAPGPDLLFGGCEVDGRVVEVRADASGSACVTEGVAASAAARREDLLAGSGVALTAATTAAASSALGREGARYGLGRRRRRLPAAAARDNGERKDGDKEREVAGHRARSIPTSAAT